MEEPPGMQLHKFMGRRVQALGCPCAGGLQAQEGGVVPSSSRPSSSEASGETLNA